MSYNLHIWHINWWNLVESNHSLRIFSPMYNNRLYESSKFGCRYWSRTNLRLRMKQLHNRYANLQWQAIKESNSDLLFWKELCYHYTNDLLKLVGKVGVEPTMFLCNGFTVRRPATDRSISPIKKEPNFFVLSLVLFR